MNKMREIGIEKVTLNIGTGEAGEKLEKAKQLLSLITGAKPVTNKSTGRIPNWSVRPGLELGVKVTLRGKKAEEVIARLLQARENTLNDKSFDNYGNFSFGLTEYIDIEGMSYQPEIGSMGLEAAVTIERKGFRIKRRKYLKKQVPHKHRITKEESMEFVKSKFNVIFEEEEEK